LRRARVAAPCMAPRPLGCCHRFHGGA
jgi:hypothetical protein